MLYKKVDDVVLTARDARERFQLEGRQLLRRVLNEVLAEVDLEFQRAIHDGTIVEFVPDRDELKRRLLKHAKKELASG